MTLFRSEGFREFFKSLLINPDVDNRKVIIMERISSMWTELQKQNRLPKGEITSHCESEVKELISHIDKMMDSQRTDWDLHLKEVEGKLLQKEHEILIQRSTLEQKHKEIGHLKHQVRDLEDSQRTGISEYETHLTTLKEEVQKVKRDYEKLSKRHQKQAKESRHDKETASLVLQDNASELAHTKDKVEEYLQKAKDWELQRRTFQKQIETLEHQRRALTEKCDFVQGQSQSYQSQVERRRQLLDNTEVSFRSQIGQLEGQLERTSQSLVIQEGKVEKLRLSLEDAVNAHKKAMDDNERLLTELNKANTSIKKLHEERTQMEADVLSKEDFLRAANEDSNGYRDDMLRMEAALTEKDNIIRSLGDIRNKEEAEQVRLLREAMHSAKEESRKHKRSEKQLKDEVSRLQSQLQNAVEDCERLAEDLEQKKAALDRLESNEYAKFRSEISRLQDDLQAERESHAAEVEGMNEEVAKLTSDLHTKDVAMATLSHKTSTMEKQIRDEMELTQKKTAEFQVATAQIEAVRLENRHLRQTILQQAHTNADRTITEEHLRVVQSSYSTSISKLENENQQLREEMECLKEEMSELEERYEEQVCLALQKVKDSAHDERIKRLEGESERRVNEIQERLNTSAQQYREEIRVLKVGKAQLEAQLELEKRLRNADVDQPSRQLDTNRSAREARRARYSDPSERQSHYSSVSSPSRFSVMSHSSDTERSSQLLDRSHYSDTERSSQSLDPDRSTLHVSEGEDRLPRLDLGLRDSDADDHRPQNVDSQFRIPRPPIESTNDVAHSVNRSSHSNDLDNDLGTYLSVRDNANASFDTINSSRAMSISESLQDDSMEMPNARVSVSKKFLAAENKRAKELEFLIDSHIEDLKHGTDKIVKKYNRRH